MKSYDGDNGKEAGKGAGNGCEEKRLFFDEKNLPFAVFLTHNVSSVPQHWHKHLELLYLIEGKSVAIIDGEEFQLEQDDFIIVNSGENHAFIPLSSCRFIVIQFRPSVINPDLTSLYETRCLLPFLQRKLEFSRHIRPADNKLLDLLNEIVDDFTTRPSGYELGIKGSIYRIFSWLIANRYIVIPNTDKVDSDDISRLTDLLQYIDTHFSEKITDETASKMAFMSYHHFCRVFKRITGRTFVEYLNYVRLREAGKLLAGSSMPVGDIALAVGFSSVTYFNRVFKREKGIPPLSFRKQNSAKKQHK